MHGEQLTAISVATVLIYDGVLNTGSEHTDPPIGPCISVVMKFHLLISIPRTAIEIKQNYDIYLYIPSSDSPS